MSFGWYTTALLRPDHTAIRFGWLNDRALEAGQVVWWTLQLASDQVGAGKTVAEQTATASVNHDRETDRDHGAGC